MRRTAVLFPAFAAVVLAAALVLPAAAIAKGAPKAPTDVAPSGAAKVVIVVGPSDGATDSYLSDAASAAAEARRWTTNVITLYTPDATWNAVLPALQGASVVVFMGHGNGFPNPRSKTFDPTSQDGLGLNPTGGGRTRPTAYYGEQYLADQVRLAPSAVVILGHLCYAGGGSEPGMPDPTPAVARQRADNFAAGWASAGARAVIADAWFGAAAYYIGQLFSTQAPIEDIWRGSPSSNASEDAAPSARTAGATVRLDPEGTTYWRALTSFPGLTAADVVGGRVVDTTADPATLQVPGAAEVGPAGVALYPTPALVSAVTPGVPVPTLPPGTRLRVISAAGSATAGTDAGHAIVEVRTLDGTLSGFAVADGLIPRDSRPPLAYLVTSTGPAFSPNGDGVLDTFAASGRLSEQSTWTATVAAASGTVVRAVAGTGDSFSIDWNGLGTAGPAPDGRYAVSVSATDTWGNAATVFAATVVLDTTAPVLSGLATTQAIVSPNGDGVADTLKTTFVASEPATLSVVVRDASGMSVDASEVHVGAGKGSIVWDGRGSSGAVLPDGRYSYEIVARDDAGNATPPVIRPVLVTTTLASVRSSAQVFDPVTSDAVVRDTALSFTLMRPASVTWTIVDAAGRTVRTFAAAQPTAAGPQEVRWDGRGDAGALVPRGTYSMIVRADDGMTVAAQRVAVVVDAFRIAVSPAAPTRGGSTTITVTTALALAGAPTLTIAQPGLVPWRATLGSLDPMSWRVKVRLRTGGTAGTLVVSVAATGAAGTPATTSMRASLR